MNAQSDPQLLRAYAERRSEAAFAELVRRHIDLVHSAARRMVNDPHLAKDVSQAVFVALAKDANKLADRPVLSGWLHRTTRNIAAQAVRTEVRRRTREKEAAAMNEPPETNAAWEEIAPHLDAALADLNESDRDAVLLRYFENKPAQEMAALLGISAEAAQKRVSRAVEKLRENFAKRGLTAGAAGLAGAISANAVQAAPAGLAAAVSSAALAGTVSTTAATTKALAMTTLQKTLVATAIALIAGTSIYQFHRNPQARELTHLKSDITRLPERRQREGGSVVEQIAKARAEKPPVDRQKELEKLKQRWIEVGNGNDKTKEQDALAKESATLLMCSRETLDLLNFLTRNEFRYGAAKIDTEVAALFDTPSASEARKLLVELPETLEIVGERSYKDGGGAYRDRWSLAAGRTCPEHEFDSFRTALNCKHCALEALYGRNIRLMQSDPMAAFISSLEAYKSGVPSISGRYGITRLFENEIPQDFDWGAAEKCLPVDSAPSNALPRKPYVQEPAFTEIRRYLLRDWAKVDPAAAANHVISNPDRLAPDLMREIVSGYSYKDCNGIVAWVTTFPEGPYFDSAAGSAAIYARGTPGIDELIRKIQDPKLREEAVKSAQVPLANPNTR